MQCGILTGAVRALIDAPEQGVDSLFERSWRTARGAWSSACTGGSVAADNAVFGLDNFAACLLTSGYRYTARRRGIRESVGTRAE